MQPKGIKKGLIGFIKGNEEVLNKYNQRELKCLKYDKIKGMKWS